MYSCDSSVSQIKACKIYEDSLKWPTKLKKKITFYRNMSQHTAEYFWLISLQALLKLWITYFI